MRHETAIEQSEEVIEQIVSSGHRFRRASLGLSSVTDELIGAGVEGSRTVDAQTRSLPAAIVDDLRRGFGEWLRRDRTCLDPWVAFERYLGEALAEACGANEVCLYRVLDSERLLLAPGTLRPRPLGRSVTRADEIATAVVRDVQPYHADHDGWAGEVDGDTDGELICWAFPVVQDWSVQGVITVDALGAEFRGNRAWLDHLAGIVCEQWRCVAQGCQLSRVGLDPPVMTSQRNRKRWVQTHPTGG